MPIAKSHIVALVDRRFPCDHSFLEGVMEKRLPTLGVEITWLMRSIGTSVRLRRALWRYSDVILLPSLTNVRRGRLVLEYLLLALLAPLLMMQIARLDRKSVV